MNPRAPKQWSLTKQETITSFEAWRQNLQYILSLPFIIQSKHHACVLTDSQPCVQALQKLCGGEFSASPRVTSFLTTVSRYQVSLQHLAGTANLPSDFASRNASDCTEPNCQICSFVHESESSVVRGISTQEVLDNTKRLPFTSRPAWFSVQNECPDLRRVCAHLKQGTRPSKKLTNIRDLKRYLNITSISKDGLLVVQRQQPLSRPIKLIVVPRSVLDGLLTAIHHPSKHQHQMVIQLLLLCPGYECCYRSSIRLLPHLCLAQEVPYLPFQPVIRRCTRGRRRVICSRYH